MNLCYCSVGCLMGSHTHACLAISRACLATLGSLTDMVKSTLLLWCDDNNQ